MAGPLRSISYEHLVRAYVERLDAVLRGFHAGLEGLESWVPDADVLASVDGLLDAARASEQPGLVLLIGRDNYDAYVASDWRELGARYGGVQVDEDATPVRLEFTFDAERRRVPKVVKPVVDARPRPSPQVGGAAQTVPRLADGYRSQIFAAAAQCSREGRCEASDGACRVQARLDAWQLQALIDSDHRVVCARHAGGEGEDERGVLELLCRLGEGTPILEWADHGVLSVMHAALDPALVLAVSGVPQPENTSLLFARANRLVRALFASYQQLTGFSDLDNRFDPPTSDAWLAMHAAARLRRLREEFEAACRTAGFQPGEATLLELKGVSRVVVQLSDDVTTSKRRGLLFRLERELATRLESSLTVERLARRDLNVIRRL